MYMVISRWQAKPGHQADFDRLGAQARSTMLGMPGITFCEAIASGDHTVVVHGYADEATYNSLINTPDGPFIKMISKLGLEDVSEWISSERGPTLH